RVSGWGVAAARALSQLAEFVAVPDRAFDGAALLVSVPQGGSFAAVSETLVEAGASLRASALLGSHATRYTVAPPAAPPRPSGHPPSAAVARAATAWPPPMPGPAGSGISSRSCPELSMSALQRPQPRPGVLEIEAYVPGKSAAPGVARVFKLSSNETPLGPS